MSSAPRAFHEPEETHRDRGRTGRPAHARIAAGTPPANQTDAAQAAKVGPTHRLNILLAEDDAMVAHSTIAVLQRMGHQVAHALDGTAAWRRLESRLHEFDVLLLDLVMPRMNGSELAHRARTAGFAGRIILVSGLVMQVDPDALRLLGIHAFMTKPFRPADLERVLRGAG